MKNLFLIAVLFVSSMATADELSDFARQVKKLKPVEKEQLAETLASRVAEKRHSLTYHLKQGDKLDWDEVAKPTSAYLYTINKNKIEPTLLTEHEKHMYMHFDPGRALIWAFAAGGANVLSASYLLQPADSFDSFVLGAAGVLVGGGALALAGMTELAMLGTRYFNLSRHRLSENLEDVEKARKDLQGLLDKLQVLKADPHAGTWTAMLETEMGPFELTAKESGTIADRTERRNRTQASGCNVFWETINAGPRTIAGGFIATTITAGFLAPFAYNNDLREALSPSAESAKAQTSPPTPK